MHQGIAVVPGSLTAILEKRPARPDRDRLLVVVDVRIEVGRGAALAAAVPQGINPQIKLLRLDADHPAGAATPLVRQTLRYEEMPAAGDYREVWLSEGDAALSVEVLVAV